MNTFKSEVRYNVIIGYKGDCSNKLVSYLAQFGNEEKYHLLLDKTESEQDKKDKIKNKLTELNSLFSTKLLMIYNFISDDNVIIEYINTEYGNIHNADYNTLIHYGIERKYFFENLNSFNTLLVANEFLNPNKTDNEMGYIVGDTSIAIPTAAPTTEGPTTTGTATDTPSPTPSTNPPATPTPTDIDKYTNSEILLYQMMEMLRKVFSRKTDIESNQVLFELFNKDLYGANMKYGLIKNLRIVANIMVTRVGKEDPTDPASDCVLTNVTEIPVRYLVPIAQVQGEPQNVTCDITYDDPVINADDSVIFIPLTFYGRNDRGYYEGHKLIALLAAIDLINEKVYLYFYIFTFICTYIFRIL